MRGISRRRFIGAVAANAGLLLSPLARSEDLVPPPSADAAMLWEPQPRMRLIWVGAAASIPGAREQIEPDPNGAWINKRTGERYSQFETPGPAGAGFVVADVLAADPGGFLVWFTSLLIPLEGGGATRFIEANGLACGPQNIFDYWVAPARLTGFRDVNESRLRVLHMPYGLDGRSYRAIRIQTQSGNGWSQNTYDLDSGLCLFTSTTVQGGPVRVLDPDNRIGTGAGNTLVTYAKLAGVRATSLPGPGAVYPESVRRLRSLTYSGTRTYTIPGTHVAPFPVQLRYDVVSNAGAYLNASVSISGVQGAYDRVIPAGVIGSLWTSPESLARYSAGQVLDRDSVTGVETVASGRQGNLALLALQTRLARQTFGYDLRSGLLMRAESRQQIGIVTDALAVELAGTH